MVRPVWLLKWKETGYCIWPALSSHSCRFCPRTWFSSLDRLEFCQPPSVLSDPVKNFLFRPLSSMLRMGWELSGSSELDESSLLVPWFLRLANWCFIALLRKGYCFLNILGEGAADVLKADSVSFASVLCALALCLHLSIVMILSADSLSSVVNSSLVSFSIMSSLQILSNCSFWDLKSSKVLRSMFRPSLLLRSSSKSSFTAFHSITFSEVVAWGCSLLLMKLWTCLPCWLC